MADRAPQRGLARATNRHIIYAHLVKSLFAIEDPSCPNRIARTLVTFLLDRTGSMKSIRDDTIGGFNAYLDGLKGDGTGTIEFTLIQFELDQRRQNLRRRADRRGEQADPRYLSAARLHSASSTPPTRPSRRSRRRASPIPPSGSSSASRPTGKRTPRPSASWNELNALVKEKAAKGWQFNFMGVGIDAYDQAARMGVPVAATMAYDHRNAEATRAAFAASAESARAFSLGRAARTVYCEAQKRSAGDRFADLFKKESKSDKPAKTAKRELKKAIVTISISKA